MLSHRRGRRQTRLHCISQHHSSSDGKPHLLRLTLDISLRSAGASRGLSSSNAQSRSSETLHTNQRASPVSIASKHTSCTLRSYRILHLKRVVSVRSGTSGRSLPTPAIVGCAKNSHKRSIIPKFIAVFYNHVCSAN